MIVDNMLTCSVKALVEETGMPFAVEGADPSKTLVLEGGGTREQWRLIPARSARGFLRAQTPAVAGAAIVFPYATPAEARRLREAGHQFLDEAGNAYLSSGPVFICVAGRARPAPAEQKGHKAFGGAGIKVTLALLTTPELAGTPYRTLGDVVGVTHGAANNAVRDLEALGYVETYGGKRQIVRERRLQLLAEWASAYDRKLRAKLILGRYRMTLQDPSRWARLDPDRCAWSGDVAASLLGGDLRPQTFTLYVNASPSELARTLKLVPQEDGEVEVLQLFWKPHRLRKSSDLVPVAPLPLVYADLVSQRDARSVEAAQSLLYRIQDR